MRGYVIIVVAASVEEGVGVWVCGCGVEWVSSSLFSRLRFLLRTLSDHLHLPFERTIVSAMPAVLYLHAFAVARHRLSWGSIRTSAKCTAASHAWCVVSAALRTPRRAYTNALYRLPPQHTVPTHAPSGEEVDAELLLRQVKGLFETLKTTQLVESVHEMKSCPYYECMFTNELMFQHWDMILPMPKFGREHRSTEVSETLRYMRACGSTGDINHILQDVKGGRASGSDFVSTTHGILMGYGTSRTNRLSMMAMTGASSETESQGSQMRALSVEPIELYEDSPPLADIVAFGGTRSLLISDTKHGHHAAEQATKLLPKVNFQVLKLEAGCNFLSHMCGASYVYDVLCDQDYPISMERLGECGLNPFPVEWTEPRKLGISMRSVCLIGRFARGTMNAGGYANSSVHYSAHFNYHSRNASKNARLFQGGQRRHGDQGAGPEAQMRAGELQNPVRQRAPRYAPPLHRSGPIVPQQ